MVDQNTQPQGELNPPPAPVQTEEEKIWVDLEAADVAERNGEPAPAVENPAQPLAGSGADQQPAEPSGGGSAGVGAKPQAQQPQTQPQNEHQRERQARREKWEKADPALKAEHDQLYRAKKAADGRVSALAKKVDELSAKVAPQQADPLAATAKAREEVKRLGGDYPEIAKPLGVVLDVIEDKEKQQQAAETSRQKTALEDQAARMREEARLLEDYSPGWRKFLSDNSDAFNEWINGEAPAHLNHAYLRNFRDIVNADETAAVLDAFKSRMGAPADPGGGARTETQQRQQPATRRERQLTGSASPRRPAAVPAVTVPSGDNPQALWDEFEAKDRRQAR